MDILCKPRSKVEVFNDLNTDVVNVFELLRSDRKRRELCFRLCHTPYSRLQFAKCLEVLHSDEQDSVRRAWAFLYCSMCRFGGVDPGICTAGSFAVPKRHGLRSDWFNVVVHSLPSLTTLLYLVYNRSAFSRATPPFAYQVCNDLRSATCPPDHVGDWRYFSS